MSKTAKYINRELSWLEFNARVLEEAFARENAPLERAKFLAITASNLDEFFRVRVGGLMLVEEAGSGKTDLLGLTATQQLELIREQVLVFNSDQADCFRQLESELADRGLVRLTGDHLSESQARHVAQFVRDEVVSTVTPIGLPTPEALPNLFGSRLCLCVRFVASAENQLVTGDGDASPEPAERYVVIPLGQSLPRILPVPSPSGFQYMLVEDAIRLHLEELVGVSDVIECAVFRITRNADLVLDEDGVSDLLLGMQELLDQRKFGGCVRLEIAAHASSELEGFLRAALEIGDREVYHIEGPLDFSALFRLAGTPGFQDLKQDDWPSQPSPDFEESDDLFETIAAGDRLLSHPYQRYEPVIRFLQQAAEDPNVIAIKQTLYRTAQDSQIAQALVDAAERGKNVTAIVELKARFDEARNIHWAQRLERAGVDVIYGVGGLKTHAKVCVVVRREPTGIRRYMHFGTGNYNEATAELYSDISYFTDDEQLGMDAVHFFNAISGLSIPQPLVKLAAAPINLREKLLELIEVEVENATAGQPAGIMAKLNSLVDRDVIDALYRASRAGVQVDLNVRGICCLRAGVEGLSENIRVISIVDRFLEHSRIFWFRHGGDERLFISSADWMNRNLDKRVELMVPVDDEKCRSRLRRILRTYFKDNVKCRELGPDDHYHRVPRQEHETEFRSQRVLYQEAVDFLTTSTNPRTTVFKPHRGETG